MKKPIYKRVNELLNTDYKSDYEINWNELLKYNDLSKNFIREFKDKVNWYNISIYQNLSEDFKKEFKDKIFK